MSRQPGRLFNNWLTIKDNGEWKNVEAWEFIEADSDKQAIKRTKEWIENGTSRVIEVFALLRHGRVIATEEDIFDY